MVIVQLLGGMGNQMFQFALGRALSLANQSILTVDTSILLDHRPGQHAVNRNYDLDIFNLKVSQATPSDRWKYNWHGLSVPVKVLARLRAAVVGNQTVREKHFQFDPGVMSMKGELYLAGLWQAYKYFEMIPDIIKQDFRLKDPLSPQAQQLAQKISGVNAVCINVRRGDFVTVGATSQSIGFVGIEYYKKAITSICDRHTDAQFFIFSDDIEWCGANFAFLGSKMTIVDHTYKGPKFAHYLGLMQQCRHFIIPNSTFAWWAAWLCERKGKSVIAPRNWFVRDHIDTSDLIPNEWVRL